MAMKLSTKVALILGDLARFQNIASIDGTRVCAIQPRFWPPNFLQSTFGWFSHHHSRLSRAREEAPRQQAIVDLRQKRVKHYHDPGDLHELTFSCYRRLKLLANDAWRTNLARSIDAAMLTWSMQLVAFVFMPEHVHLLVLPLTNEPEIDKLLWSIKRGVQRRRQSRFERHCWRS
jgi:putative transposase